jgi:hypothetical protein
VALPLKERSKLLLPPGFVAVIPSIVAGYPLGNVAQKGIEIEVEE